MIRLLLGLWLLQAAAADRDDWVCVAAADGSGWECGRGEQAPSVRSLPPREPPAQPSQGSSQASDSARAPASPEPRPTIFAPFLPVRGEPQRPADEEGPAIPGGYALQIASLSSEEDLLDFARNFEIDPSAARQARSADGRILLLYGRYDDPQAARAARENLPALLKALQPTIRNVQRLAGDLEPIGLATGEAPTPEPIPPDESAGEEAAMVATPTAEPVIEPAPRDAGPEMAASAAPEPAMTVAPEPADPWRDSAAFAAAEGPYTIQLANLPDADAARDFIAAHRLDGALFLLPDAAGRRLLLLGRYPDLATAEMALRGLPGSLVAPWVRRARPLVPGPR